MILSRRVSKNNNLSKKCFKLAEQEKSFPHNVIVFEEEHRLYLSNVVEAAVESSSSKNHSAVFPIELPSWFIHLFTKEGDVVLVHGFWFNHSSSVT
jgi:site-specific DNA-methyltransferase (adenine-specific)/site-specific DNA-methyltransferase (cytosine-N4-specific)